MAVSGWLWNHKKGQPYMKLLANSLSAFNNFSSGPYYSECGLYVFCNAQWIYFHELQSSLVNF